MECNLETVLTSLKHPSDYKATPNKKEEFFFIAEEVFSKERDSLLEAGWKADKKGDNLGALFYYKAANIYLYLTFLAINYRENLELVGKLGVCDKTLNLEDPSYDCIVKSLECLSAKYNTPYLKLWEELLIELGIFVEECSCCVGIGAMIIEDEDLCKAFVLTSCNNEGENCGLVEFPENEFPCNEFI